MEHLFSAWAEISERVSNAGQILLLTDFDGTLSPIVDRPEEAVLPDETRRALEVLASHVRVSVAVVSGRALSDIKNRVGIQGMTYAGNHGIEVEGPCLKFVYRPAESIRPVIRQLYSTLSKALASVEGAFVEDKGITLSVHYRLVGDDGIDELKRICEESVRVMRAEGKIRTTEGKKVYEIRPGVVWDKEDAIGLLLACCDSPVGESTSLAFFLGDDLTDEGGFRVLNTHGGVSIYVGESASSSAAKYFLRSPDEVVVFLERLCQAVGSGQPNA